MLFEVLTQKGFGDNALLGGNRAARQRQSPQEHAEEEALLAQGIPEQTFKYWNDAYPRAPVFQSSGWINDFNYDPNSKILTVLMGDKGHSQTFSGVEPNQVEEWLTSSDLGKHYWQYYRNV